MIDLYFNIKYRLHPEEYFFYEKYVIVGNKNVRYMYVFYIRTQTTQQGAFKGPNPETIN